jgi:hypothetical protein
LKIITTLDFTDPDFEANFSALLDDWDGVPQLFAYPNLVEFVPKSNSPGFSEKVLTLMRRYLWEGAAVFGWPSSQRRHASGCSVWTNAGDVNLALEDIRPADHMLGAENKHEFAAGFITGALSSGPKPRKDVYAAALKAGIRKTTFNEAARELVNSVRSRAEFGEATWELRENPMDTLFSGLSSHLGAENG